MSTVLLLISAIILWIIYDNLKERPPGPPRLPFFGNLLHMLYYARKEPHTHIMLQNFSQKYGPISSLKFGTLEQVIIDDPVLIREILQSDNWGNRPINPYIMERSYGKPFGILWGRGEWHKELRRFSLRTLRDFGFGKQQSQDAMMHEELTDLMSDLNSRLKEEGGVICMQQFFNVSVLNLIWSMLASKRFSRNDPELQDRVHRINETMRLLSATGNLLLAFPFLSSFVRNCIGFGRVRNESMAEMHETFLDILKERREQKLFMEEQKDFVDVFASEIEKHKASANGLQEVYTDKQYVVTMMDLFVAGSETTANSLEYSIMLMMLHPEVQEKVREEIDAVIGRERFPVSTDKMPYTEATTLEIIRMSSVIPVIVRSPMEDTMVGGFAIHKETWTILNTYSCHWDGAVWGNPEKFDPTRFLENGVVVNGEKLIAFGLGKRYCLGEKMAKATLFTFFVTMIQKYEFSLPDGYPKPKLHGRPGITLSPEKFYAKIKPRTV